jgi:hypothetical protein
MVTEQAIKVSQETYHRLDAQARARGLNIEKFVEILLQEFDKARESAFIESLRAEGLLVSTPTASPNTPRNFKPVPIQGEPLSQTIIEDRE